MAASRFARLSRLLSKNHHRARGIVRRGVRQIGPTASKTTVSRGAGNSTTLGSLAEVGNPGANAMRRAAGEFIGPYASAEPKNVTPSSKAARDPPMGSVLSRTEESPKTGPRSRNRWPRSEARWCLAALGRCGHDALLCGLYTSSRRSLIHLTMAGSRCEKKLLTPVSRAAIPARSVSSSWKSKTSRFSAMRSLRTVLASATILR